MKKENLNIEIIETSATVIEEHSAKGLHKLKSKKLKNQALFKKGGFSLAITALVLAALILFNWLTSMLNDRFDLTRDLTIDKKNSISEENIDFLKSVKDDVDIVVCCKREQYIEYMQYLAYEAYTGAEPTLTDVEYYNQTLILLDRYEATNKKIKVRFIDPQAPEFTSIAADYVDEQLTYGDMIVTSSATEEYKVLRFSDIYALSESTSSSYYSTYTISANRLETSLTSAIAFVTNTDVKKVGIIISHSNNDCYLSYQQALLINNYEVTLIEDQFITTESVKDDYDLLVISAPTSDFSKTELDIISGFLDNDGNLGKGLVFFADAAAPNLPNLYGFLKQWGIEVSEGKIYETDPYYMSTTTRPDIIALMPNVSGESEDSKIISAYDYAITGYNVPMKVCDSSTYERTTKVFLQTSPSAVIAPKDAAANWSEYTPSDKKTFDCVIQSTESDFDKDNHEIQSYVIAFSSVEFIHSEWAEESALYNKELVLKCTQRAAHVDDGTKIFTAKVIDDSNTFAAMKDAKDEKTVNTIFMFIIPTSMIVVGIVIFIRRKNAK